MKMDLNLPQGIIAWQSVCESCGYRCGVLIAQRDDGFEDERPKHCPYCAYRVSTFRARVDVPAIVG